MMRGKEVAVSSAIGTGGALAFLFIFPKGSLATLMHEVLHLPGPGAGIAMVLGPLLVLVALTSFQLGKGTGCVIIASLTFAVAYSFLTELLTIPTNSKGSFGTVYFIIALLVFGLATEVISRTGRSSKTLGNCMLAGALSNMILLIYYWVAIFPRTAGWVEWRNVTILVVLCLLCGVISGYIAGRVSQFLSRLRSR